MLVVLVCAALCNLQNVNVIIYIKQGFCLKEAWFPKRPNAWQCSVKKKTLCYLVVFFFPNRALL